MSEETKVSNEAVVDSGTENVTQDNAQNEYIAESKKYRKRAQDAETQLTNLQKKLESQENTKLKEKEEFTRPWLRNTKLKLMNFLRLKINMRV